MAKFPPRKTTYGRDVTDRLGQGLLPWAPGRTLSTAQAAQRIGISEDTMNRMCEAGEIEAYRLRPKNPRSPWRIPRHAVEKHIGSILEEFSIEP